MNTADVSPDVIRGISRTEGVLNTPVPSAVSLASLPGPRRLQRRMQHLRGLLLDPTPLTRECLSLSLSAMDPSVEVLSVSSVEEAVAVLHHGEPIDVAICNIGHAGLDQPDGAALVRALLGVLGEVPLLVISEQDEFEAIFQGFHLGVRGYVTTKLGFGLAMDAIRLVAAGGLFIPGATLDALMRGQAATGFPPAANAPDDSHGRDDAGIGAMRLTPRENAVMKCLREGKANKLIARELNMRESTVKAHVGNIMKKLGANNRTQAAFLAYERTPSCSM